MLQIQYNRLEEWALASRLDAEDASEYEAHIARNESLVVATLSHLELELKRLRATELDYEFLAAAPVAPKEAIVRASPRKLKDLSDPETERSSLEPQQLRAKLDVALGHQNAQFRKDRLFERCKNRIVAEFQGVKTVAKQPKRFKWATQDKAKFEENMTKVRELVDALTQLLSRDQLKVVVSNTAALIEMLLHLSSDVGEIKSLLEAAGSPEAATRAPASLSGSTAVEIHETDHDAFWTKAAQFTIDAGGLDLSSINEDSSRLFSWDDQLTMPQVPAERVADGKTVWLEWKTFDKTIEISQGARESVVPSETIDRVKRLVGLLQLPAKPREFCVPPCLGYFRHPAKDRYGLVFESPPDSISGPRSLLTLYSTHTAFLSDRIQVAQKLSQWLLCFHTVNWLHKGLRSDSVLFFPSTERDLGRPYVGGFEYSRPASDQFASMPPPDNEDRAMYTHPKYLETLSGFRKTYDIYSLGIILVELAYWQPIERIIAVSESVEQVRPETPVAKDPATDGQASRIRVSSRGVQKRLLMANSPFLRYIEINMGEKYFQATKACLQGGSLLGLQPLDDQSDIRVSARLRQCFIDEVVEPLKAIEV